jgi:septum formation topological specificity factor MinE
VKRTARPITAKYLQNAAAFYLERYPSTAEGLRRVLNRRVRRAQMLEAPVMENVKQAIEAVVAKFVDAGVIDDKAFAQTKARALHRRGTSTRLTRRKLQIAGVDDDALDQAMVGLDLIPIPANANGGPRRHWRGGEGSVPTGRPTTAKTIGRATWQQWPAPASPTTLPRR